MGRVQKMVCELDIVLIIEYVQCRYYLFVTYILATERNRLVKKSQSIPHCPICFLGYYVKGFNVNCHTLFKGNLLKVSYNILHGDSVEVIGLTS
ncbi:hypothetical protein SDC9_148579 [bioreactor metagenome]|uniref:Uncharacterized protein n=1 Tax=bioreactor metagenome TaxID=1076179 RepID=A0A645EJ64_9ZZZZ